MRAAAAKKRRLSIVSGRSKALENFSGLPVLRDSDAGELLGALLEQVGQAVDHRGALAGGDAAPVAAAERGVGGRDGALGVLRRGVGDLGERLAGGGIADGPRARGGDVLAVDQQRADSRCG